jgi:hypothetical protein
MALHQNHVRPGNYALGRGVKDVEQAVRYRKLGDVPQIAHEGKMVDAVLKDLPKA